MTATTETTDQCGDATAAAGPAVTATRDETLGRPGPTDTGTGSPAPSGPRTPDPASPDR